jgi:hypothetical protein
MCNGNILSLPTALKHKAKATKESTPPDNNKNKLLLPASNLILSIINRSLLVAYIYLYMGWASPFIVYIIARLGAIARNRFLGDVTGTILGWYDKRTSYLAWSMG